MIVLLTITDKLLSVNPGSLSRDLQQQWAAAKLDRMTAVTFRDEEIINQQAGAGGEREGKRRNFW